MMIKNEYNNKFTKIWLLLMSMATAMMLIMPFYCEEQIDCQCVLADILYNLGQSIQNKAFILMILTMFFFALGINLQGYHLPGDKAFRAMTVFLSLIWLCGESFSIDNTMSHIAETPVQIVKSVIYFIGASYFIYNMTKMFVKFVYTYSEPEKSNYGLLNWIWNKFEKRPFRVSFVILILCWSLNILSSYPAKMCPDTWMSVNQFWGYSTFTSHHPPVFSIYVGFFTWIGKLIGNIYMGFFLYIVIQSILYSAIISYSVKLLMDLNAARWLVYIYLFTVACTPYYTNYVGLIIKDTIYSIFFLLFIIELIYAFKDFESYSKKKSHLFFTFVSIIGVFLMRNNGKYVLYPTLICIVFLLHKYRKRFDKKYIFNTIATIIGAVILAQSILTITVSVYNVQKGSIAEALSLPFQQTARYVSEFPDEVTKEEKDIISNVLDYDNLATLYVPTKSDRVKASYRGNSNDDLIQYIKVWIKMFFRHPLTYVKATLNQNYFLFYPFIGNDKVYLEFNSSVLDQELASELGIEQRELNCFQKVMHSWDCAKFSLPIVGVLSQPFIYIFVFLILLILSIKNKLYKSIILILPILLSVLVILLAPVIQGHPRYAFPIIYSVPLVLGYYVHLTTKIKSNIC